MEMDSVLSLNGKHICAYCTLKQNYKFELFVSIYESDLYLCLQEHPTFISYPLMQAQEGAEPFIIRCWVSHHELMGVSGCM